MRGPSQIPAMTMSESVWLSIATAFTILALLMLVSGPNLQALFVREVPPSRVAHTPLPDLCAVFPGGAAAGLTLKPQAEGAELDRNNAACLFEVAGSTGERRLQVWLDAARPEPKRWDKVTAADELNEARQKFRAHDKVSVGVPLPGLGEEAKVKTESDAIIRKSTVVVRDGLLVFSVAYEEQTMRGGRTRTSPDTVRDTTQRLAAELLKLLPPKGK